MVMVPAGTILMIEQEAADRAVASRRRIVAAAIKEGDLVCFVKRPGRHGDVIRQMATEGFPIPITGEQGFITSDGLFVDRVTANRIAVMAAQTLPAPCNGVEFETVGRELFSEDVW